LGFGATTGSATLGGAEAAGVEALDSEVGTAVAAGAPLAAGVADTEAAVDDAGAESVFAGWENAWAPQNTSASALVRRRTLRAVPLWSLRIGLLLFGIAAVVEDLVELFLEPRLAARLLDLEPSHASLLLLAHLPGLLGDADVRSQHDGP